MPSALSAAPPAAWSAILIDAVRNPGVISSAYRSFWNYSVGNQLLALWQCALRGIEVGPLHTFQGWKQIGRHVKKGEKAITLCMPVTVKRRPSHPGADPISPNMPEAADARRPTTGDEPPGAAAQAITVFTYKPHWFVLSQTEGADYAPTELPDWSEAAALASLGMQREPFCHPNGNCQGYAWGRAVAVSPLAALPHKTLFHEMAHVVLGHTAEVTGQLDDHDATPKNLREVEAECVALICCNCLALPGDEFCRGYIQHWLGAEQIPERSAQKIFKAADQVIKAGRPTPSDLPSDHD